MSKNYKKPKIFPGVPIHGKSKRIEDEKIRPGYFISYDKATNKYNLILLSNKDNDDTNWLIIRSNGTILTSRDYYYIQNNSSEFHISKSNFILEPLTKKEINIVNKAKANEVWFSNNGERCIGLKKDFEISTRTHKEEKNSSVYKSIVRSPGIKNFIKLMEKHYSKKFGMNFNPFTNKTNEVSNLLKEIKEVSLNTEKALNAADSILKPKNNQTEIQEFTKTKKR
ncbi:hypothetical protein [Williamsoniiplasma lucivorax]|uniref:Uncharacterized protein n=1 Tax=Williamsoniiplasma lucivorax TaxID=209274 RepID=A0A2S5RF38_9MOLU|nr:hypothetical protein [Williamsoniiplasma lucivorax]PPE05946.1 hypothetical protein ELUCI_v1c02370 [Williamsoniiplasma lucivorax]